MNIDEYLKKYSDSHQNYINIAIHKVCVPAIMGSLIGILESIIPSIDLSWALIFGGMIFYSRFKNLKLIVAILCQLFPIKIILMLINYDHKLFISATIFILAWTLQFVGHFLEKQRPSFFDDLLFLLIGPVWVFRRQFGISKI